MSRTARKSKRNKQRRSSQQTSRSTPEIIKVAYADTQLAFEATSDAVIWRANTLFEKEPDTVHWISQFAPGDVFFDIGANVGMYSVLAGKGRGARVFAFEPEAQNYALLNRNLVYNEIHNTCIAYPLALAEQTRVDKLYLSQWGVGGSCHSFGASVDYHLAARDESVNQGCVAFSVDQLVAGGTLPPPQHIKIDVDGIEHLVIQGAEQTLQSDTLQSVLIELNTHLPEHNALIDQLHDLGFVHDQRQVELAVRTEGAFSGIGNYIFYKPDSGICFDDLSPAPGAPVLINSNKHTEHLRRHLQNAFQAMEIKYDPYPHFHVTNVFPDDYYQALLANKPSNDELVCINATGRAQGFPERFVMHLSDGTGQLNDPKKAQFWRSLNQWLCSDELMVTLVQRFYDQITARGVSQLNVKPEAMFMRDFEGYTIGPHTDSPRRLMSVMFYLPEDDQHPALGTTVYRPKTAGFTSSGTEHHYFDQFETVYTAPYQPNSLFGFFKTENSFHGVPRLAEDYARDSMVYIIKHQDS